MNPRKIVVNGKTYSSVDEMPPEVRRQYEEALQALGDANGNLIPDLLEGQGLLADRDRDGIPDLLQGTAAGSHVVSQTKIIVDGREFDSVESLPPDARARYEEAMSRLTADSAAFPARAAAGMAPARRDRRPAAGGNREGPGMAGSRAPDTSSGGMLVIVGVFILLLCLAAAGSVWYFFLR